MDKIKYIREGRFGPPKCFKTGAVVGTYPKPMLVFEYESGGLDIIEDQSQITYVNVEELKAIIAEGKVPTPIVALDLSFTPMGKLTTDYVPAKDKVTFDNTINGVNALSDAPSHPFKTVVLDTVTGLSDCIWSHQAVTNSAALADARKWAGNIGLKTKQVIDFLTMPQLKCNSVFIFHTEVNKDELTQKTTEQPMVYSKLRDSIGRLFSQFFYQSMVAGKPQIRVKSFDLVTGIGVRWPKFSKELVDPTFDAIYGKEPNVFK